MARSEFAEQFADLVEQDEAYRERIQRALIPRELLLLPEAFARFQARVEERASRACKSTKRFANVRAEMREGFARVDEQFAEVRAEQQRQAAEQRRQANDIAKLKGFVLELIFDRRAPAVFGRYWRRVKVVPATEICELAESIQPLTPEEEESLYRADAYVMGVRKSDGREIIGVVEVSWMVDIGDVERAQRRAEVLMQRGLLAVPVVAGGEATQTAEQAAQRGACALLLDGIFKYPSAVG
jgi:hypothetical protein